MKLIENETLKKENEKMKAEITKGGYDPKNPTKAIEFNKIRLLEEANSKLKSELDDLYKALDEKEHTIQANKIEVSPFKNVISYSFLSSKKSRNIRNK